MSVSRLPRSSWEKGKKRKSIFYERGTATGGTNERGTYNLNLLLLDLTHQLFLIFFNFRVLTMETWSGVFRCSTSFISWKVRPKSVRMPVATTTALACPCCTVVLMKRM